LRRTGFAPAKVNLFLHVDPVDADGYHPLVSLMVFANAGDRVSIAPADRFELAVEGAFAGALAGEALSGNLIWRAALRLFDAAGLNPPPIRLTLDKALPVAAGLGGGSSDAGAALKLLRDNFAHELDDMTLERIAGELGADGPVCLWARPAVGEGRGDTLSSAPSLPPLPAVLVNPRQACSTGQVYRTFDALGAVGGADRPALADHYATAAEAITALAPCRNDLERPALEVCPVIAEVLTALRARPESRLARLSGSGATCFALCETDTETETLAQALNETHPDWWVRPCQLGGPWPDG
jgi:4-diphosphocytidyl-2-C-methyl-D-erythritol kinase